MTITEKEVNKELIAKTIDYLEGIGYTDIKADLDGYDSPKSFRMTSSGNDITPDIVATASNGKVQYIEIGVKSSDPVLLKSKWQFLQTLAEMKNRGFKVITHKGHYGFTDQIIEDIKLQKNPVRL